VAYQILNPSALSKYKPQDINPTKGAKGEIYLNEGVSPVTGTVKQPSTNPLSTAPSNTQTNLTQGLDTTNQAQVFGNAIQDLLKQYQGVQKTPFLKAGLDAQQAQNDRISALPGADFSHADPGTQASVRNQSASALNPAIQGAQNAQATFTGQLNSFGDILNSAKSIQASLQQQAEQAKKDAQSLIENSFQNTGGEEFASMDPKELASLEKLAGYPKGFILQTSKILKQQSEAAAKAKLLSEPPKTMETSQGIVQWNPQTGQWENTGLQPKAPARSGGSSSRKSSSTSTLKKEQVAIDFEDKLREAGQNPQRIGNAYDDYIAQYPYLKSVIDASFKRVLGMSYDQFLNPSLLPKNSPLNTNNSSDAIDQYINSHLGG